tara:strand:+ start:500 stop:775 length:276 start_codon:yes stop_codon:yes gene_type:complete
MWVYKVRCEYKYVETQGICLVYSINGMDFIYDHITDKEKEDPLIVAVASSEPSISIETLTKNSEYLLLEELHPLIFPVEIDKNSTLPEEVQ